MDPRILLPNSFNLARKRPVFAILKDLFQPPSSGDTSYTDGGIISWNIPVGNHQWFDAKNSYIMCDCTITYTGMATTGATNDGNIGFNDNTFALCRKLRVFLNGIMCEDLDKYNVLAPTLASYSTLYPANSTMYTAGETMYYRRLDWYGASNNVTYNTRVPSYVEDNIRGAVLASVTTTATDGTVTLKDLCIYLPSPLVGIFANKCLPTAFFNQVMVELHLEYAEVALYLRLMTGQPALASASAIAVTGISYSLSNIKWFERFIELDGDLLTTIAEAYVADGIPRFVIPCRMWRWRFNTFTDASSSWNVPFTFNIQSAVCFVGILRNSSTEDQSVANVIKPSLTTRYCNMEKYTYYINGVPHPASGLGVQVNNSQSVVTTYTAAIHPYHSDGINKCIGTMKKSLNNSSDSNGFMFSPTNIVRDFGYFATGSLTGSDEINNSLFFLGYPLEPSSVIDGDSRAGPKLTAANDVNLYMTLNSTYTSTNIHTIRLDLFVLMDAEIIFEGGAVQFSGGT